MPCMRRRVQWVVARVASLLTCIQTTCQIINLKTPAAKYVGQRNAKYYRDTVRLQVPIFRIPIPLRNGHATWQPWWWQPVHFQGTICIHSMQESSRQWRNKTKLWQPVLSHIDRGNSTNPAAMQGQLAPSESTLNGPIFSSSSSPFHCIVHMGPICLNSMRAEKMGLLFLPLRFILRHLRHSKHAIHGRRRGGPAKSV